MGVFIMIYLALFGKPDLLQCHKNARDHRTAPDLVHFLKCDPNLYYRLLCWDQWISVQSALNNAVAPH